MPFSNEIFGVHEWVWYIIARFLFVTLFKFNKLSQQTEPRQDAQEQFRGAARESLQDFWQGGGLETSLTLINCSGDPWEV